MDARELHSGDAGYPLALATVADAPPRIWVKGPLPAGRAVAVVGARQARLVHLADTRELARGLAERGIAVISGGAIGIDGAAHRGALDGGGHTVVVQGTGIDVIYPQQHRTLFAEVLAKGGALVSQFDRAQLARQWSFPQRNHVIAALAEATVVIEAGIGSGALITAEAARHYGKRVIALAGSPGCEKLIASGALSARTVDEIFDRLEGNPVAAEPLPEDPRAARLFQALDATPRDVGDLAARAALRPDEALALAIDLELGGFAARAAGGRYLRPSW
jgi:DNA processing protein